MTWDGVPEHRNLGGDGQPKRPADFLRDFLSRPQQPPAMPADPFNGLTEAAVAQVAMIEAVRGAGLTEPQALYYVACLVQVGRAMAEGGMLGEMPDPPEGL